MPWISFNVFVPQIAAGLGFDMASLINNPAFISMVRAEVTICPGDRCLMLVLSRPRLDQISSSA